MSNHQDETELLRSVTLQNAKSILQARRRAELDLVRTKDDLEQNRQELAHSLAMMRATFESTTDAILVTDGEGNCVDSNQNFLRMWNLTRQQMAAKSDKRIMTLTSDQFRNPREFIARIDEIYVTSPAESFDVLELLDERIIERFSRIQSVNGQNVGRVWSFRDISERRGGEDALRDRNRILELLNQTGAAIASNLELKTLLQSVTDAATQLSGAAFGAFFYNNTDEKGDSFLLFTLSGAPREAFEKFGHPRATSLFGPTFRGEGPIRCYDVQKDPRYGRMAPHYGMPEGHPSVRSYLAVPVLSRGGDVIGGLFFGHPEPGIFTERTERIVVGVAAQASIAIDNARLYEDVKHAAADRERLLEAERSARAEAERVSLMKDEFLATLSHELRTPLNAILGWSQILLMDNFDKAELTQGLETIGRNARAQTQLIEDLLDMSRIISGKVRLDVQRTDLAVVIDAAIESIAPSAAAKEIRLRKILDPHAGPVSGDPNRLQQVIWNLLSNALKFTPKQGTVDVVLARVNSHLEITVSDTGAGISSKFLPYVFERFRQADPSSTRRYGGLGLGLSIVKQLVELHGGQVQVSSPGEGLGATFVVNLPVAPVLEGADRVHPRSMNATLVDCEGTILSGVKILVVDDEADARVLIERVLSRCHAEVITASDADEALALVQSERPDVILSDIGMPGKDGYQFIRDVRKLSVAEGGKTPAVALTAFARSEDRTRALLAGYQLHLSKPIEPQELIATMASMASPIARHPQ